MAPEARFPSGRGPPLSGIVVDACGRPPVRRSVAPAAGAQLFEELERVNPILMKPESIESHCNHGTCIENAIARQGQLLAGEWTRPRCRLEDLDVEPEDIRQNLHLATGDLCGAFLAPCTAARREPLHAPKVVEESQQAAEALANTIIAGFGLTPAAMHELDALAKQLENAYRGRMRGAEDRRRFAAAITPATSASLPGRSRPSLRPWTGGARRLTPLAVSSRRAASTVTFTWSSACPTEQRSSRIGGTTRRLRWLRRYPCRRCRVRFRCESRRVAVEVTPFCAGHREGM